MRLTERSVQLWKMSPLRWREKPVKADLLETEPASVASPASERSARSSERSCSSPGSVLHRESKPWSAESASSATVSTSGMVGSKEGRRRERRSKEDVVRTMGSASNLGKGGSSPEMTTMGGAIGLGESGGESCSGIAAVRPGGCHGERGREEG